ncbi:MAG: fused MFS/spermidine synthase [Ardenticatenia bacterium]|nr:fused MFS/spermidine synthase [Ardenticatenia bacterium]
MNRRIVIVGPYATSILLSAFLLFVVQPMIGRALLPVFGGAPAVWNMAMVFFQVLLLGGYAYSHWLVDRPAWQQLLCQGLVVLAPLLLLPPALPAMDPALAVAAPVRQSFLALAWAVGLPFLALSTNASLVQRWYLRRSPGDNPYWLYAASNGGSAAALIAYPLIIEPLGGLSWQSRWWAGAYLLFALVTLVLLWRDLRLARTTAAVAAVTASLPPGPGWRQKAGWALRAGLASSLLLSTTMQITTDVAAIPLLWTLTLLVYLLTFMLAFGQQRPAPRRLLALATVVGASLGLVAMVAMLKHPLALFMGISVGTLFCGAWLCHSDLARSAPAPEHLTGFFLWVTLGGAVGGMLNSLLAPQLLTSVAEYPLTLVALLWLITLTGPAARRPLGRPATVALVMVLALAGGGLLWAAGGIAGLEALVLRQLVLLMPLLVLALGAAAWLASRRAWAYAACMSMVVLYVIDGRHLASRIQYQDRSFFGVIRVLESRGERVLLHGTTVHGSERISGPLRGKPGVYYHEDGTLAQLMRQMPANGRAGIVGLGTGALAHYLEPGQRLVYYDIDPLVVRIADEQFTFLRQTRGEVDVRIADGRLGLQRDRDQDLFDLLIIDAFSSDAIPTHLLTSEALATYVGRLAPNGILAFHISNQFFDLEPVIAGSAQALDLHGARVDWDPDKAQKNEGAARLLTVVLSPDPVKAGSWARSEGGRTLTAERLLWTDDHIDLLAALAE